MKKILFLVLALCAIVSSKNVKADESILTWERIPRQQKVTHNGQEIPISVSNNKVTVTLPTGWSVWFKKDKQNYVLPKEVGKLQEEKTIIKGETTIYNGNQGLAGVTIEIPLTPNLQKGNIFTVAFKGDDGFFAGSVNYKDSKTLQEEKTKELEEKQRELDEEYADKLFKQSILDEQNKTWKDRFRDTFQDAWWNFKGWVYGPTTSSQN